MMFKLTGCIIPKARPRVTKFGTYLPGSYKFWKDCAITELRVQAASQRLVSTIDKAHVSIVLIGKHSRRSDLDNIAGSILDALVQADIIRDDNMMVITKLDIELHYSKSDPVAEIIVDPC